MKSRKQIQMELAEKLQQYRAEKQKKLENLKLETKQRTSASKPLTTPKSETRVALSASAANVKSNVTAKSGEIKCVVDGQKQSNKPKPFSSAVGRRHSVDSGETQKAIKSKPNDSKKFLRVPSRIDTGIKRRSLSASEKTSVSDENDNGAMAASIAKSGLPMSDVSALLQMMNTNNNLVEEESASVTKATKERRKSHFLSNDKHERVTGRLSTVIEEPASDDIMQMQTTKRTGQQPRQSTQTSSGMKNAKASLSAAKRDSLLSKSMPAKTLQLPSDNQRKRASSASDSLDAKKPRLTLSAAQSHKERGHSLQPAKAPVGIKPKLSLSAPSVSRRSILPATSSSSATTKKTDAHRPSVTASAPVKRLVANTATIAGPRKSLPAVSKPPATSLPPIVNSVLQRQAEGHALKRAQASDRKSLSAIDKKQDKSAVASAHTLASRKSIACTKDAVRINQHRRSVSVPLPQKSVAGMKTATAGASASARKSVTLAKAAITPAQTPKQRSRSLLSTPQCKSAIKTPSSLLGKTRSDEMREKLNAWLESRGKTPSQFRHAGCFHMKTSDLSTVEQPAKEELSNEAMSDFAINGIEKCQQLLKEQSSSAAGQWLDDVLGDHPQVTGSATYWVCRALVADASDADAAIVIDIFEQAVRSDAKPAEVVAEALQAYIAKHRAAIATVPATPSRRLRDVDEDNIMSSSAVKLRVMDSAHFFKKVRSTLDTPDRPEICILTPVRRSTRKSTLRPYTPADSAAVRLVDNVAELSEQQRAKAIFLKNDALDGSFSDLCTAE